MKRLTCAACGTAFAMSDGFAVLNRQLCDACARKEAGIQAGTLTEGSVAALVDPTVCKGCGRDNASVELPRVGRLPFCQQCEQTVRSRPFPEWLRIGLVALIALAIISLWWNERFIAGYVALVRANHAFKRGDIDGAVVEMTHAVDRVPEPPQMRGVLHFYRGIQHIRDDRVKDAAVDLTAAKELLGGGDLLERALLEARAGIAFEDHDYDAFLRHEQDALRLDPSDAMSEAGVASAYACQYAITRDEKLRTKTLDHLRKAEGLHMYDPIIFGEYKERIQYRLDTREIIDRAEYKRRFPNGREGGR
jgi:hypothetical protein